MQASMCKQTLMLSAATSSYPWCTWLSLQTLWALELDLHYIWPTYGWHRQFAGSQQVPRLIRHRAKVLWADSRGLTVTFKLLNKSFSCIVGYYEAALKHGIQLFKGMLKSEGKKKLSFLVDLLHPYSCLIYIGTTGDINIHLCPSDKSLSDRRDYRIATWETGYAFIRCDNLHHLDVKADCHTNLSNHNHLHPLNSH